jgi:metallo-beta-lactamase class B
MKFFLLAIAVCVNLVSLAQAVTRINKDLEIVALNSRTLIHTSYMPTESFGRVPCNGLIYVNGKEAVFMDAPHNDSLSKALLDWFHIAYPNVEIKAIVVEHFHNDCLGGLQEFHDRGIRSYAHKLTPALAKAAGSPVPYRTFDDELKIRVGGGKVVCRYFGEAHAKDNVISWLPDEKILFGGCMIKEDGAGKGYLGDANVAEWSNTVGRIREEFGKQVKIVVPGHGEHGGVELLDYTINLFKE